MKFHHPVRIVLFVNHEMGIEPCQKKQKGPEEEGQRAQSKVAPVGHDPENALCGWEATMRFEIEIADGNF